LANNNNNRDNNTNNDNNHNTNHFNYHKQRELTKLTRLHKQKTQCVECCRGATRIASESQPLHDATPDKQSTIGAKAEHDATEANLLPI